PRLAAEMLMTSWATRKKPNLLALSVPKSRQAAAPPIFLGSASNTSDYFLRARLNPLGASVRQVILNRFEKADAEGRPVRGEPLELVGERLNAAIGSNLLYNVANPDDNSPDNRPLNTLGETYVWEVLTAPAIGKVVKWDREEGRLDLQVQGVTYGFFLS